MVKNVPKKTINEDELIGYIIRRIHEEKDDNVYYEDVKAILDTQIEFLKEKGIAE